MIAPGWGSSVVDAPLPVATLPDTSHVLIGPPAPYGPFWADPEPIEVVLEPGDSVFVALAAQGVPSPTALMWIAALKEEGVKPHRAHAGQPLIIHRRIQPDGTPDFVGLDYPLNALEYVYVRPRDGGVDTGRRAHPHVVDYRVVRGTVTDSFWLDGLKAGLTGRDVDVVAFVFQSDIDFKHDVHAGDSFEVLLREHLQGSRRMKPPEVMAARITLKGSERKTYEAVRYEKMPGRENFFDAHGRPMPRGILRSPLKYGRISSRFSYRRMHPILGRRTAHLAVDYAAPRGTRVHAVAKGRVTFAGRKGGYGNLVVIQHDAGLTTKYAHLKGFARGIKKGASVTREQTIGYVGSTGRSTGPHLHYEMWKSGKPVNPLRVKTPPAKSIASPAFHQAYRTLAARLGPEAPPPDEAPAIQAETAVRVASAR